MTLYDYSDFQIDDIATSDSLFTDGIIPGGGDKKLIALTRRLNDGAWDSVRIAPWSLDNLYETPYSAIDDTASLIDIKEIDIPENIDPLVEIRYYAQVKNSAELGDTSKATIIYDTVKPILSNFSGPELVSDSLYPINFGGSDEYPGELAGLIVSETLVEDRNNKGPRYHYIPYDGSEEAEIMLRPVFGLRNICAYFVDKADVDQNRPDSIQARLDRNDFSTINQPSKSICFPVRMNPIEVSNYPNPIDPTDPDDNRRETKLVFPLDDDSRVQITILDPFGNLVKEWEADAVKGLNDGGFNDQLRWDGRNAKDEVVANGGYICVIKALKTGERHLRKIAVIKSSRQ